jgi:hypothetical protein
MAALKLTLHNLWFLLLLTAGASLLVYDASITVSSRRERLVTLVFESRTVSLSVHWEGTRSADIVRRTMNCLFHPFRSVPPVTLNRRRFQMTSGPSVNFGAMIKGTKRAIGSTFPPTALRGMLTERYVSQSDLPQAKERAPVLMHTTMHQTAYNPNRR